MEITVRFQGTDRLVAKLGVLDEAVTARIYLTMRQLVAALTARIKSNLSGLVLNVGSGALRDSIRGQTLQIGSDYVLGTAYSEGIPYAAIQEYGGRTSPHDIVPVNAKVLAFLAPGQPMAIGKSATQEMIFATIVHHPGSRIPERSYMRRSLVELRPLIIAELQGALKVPLSSLAV